MTDARIERRIDELLADVLRPNTAPAALLCDRHPADATAFTVIDEDLGGRDIRYGELKLASERVAGGLSSLGLGPGDRVATLMGKSEALVVTVLAIWRIGAVHVPLFTAFAPAAIADRLLASRTSLIVCDSGQRAKLTPSAPMPAEPPWRIVVAGARGSAEGDVAFGDLLRHDALGDPPAARRPGDPIVQIFTSGTTGKPKAVTVPVKALAAFAAYLEYGLDVHPDDVFWNAADPGWAYGLYYGIIGPLFVRRRNLLLETAFPLTADVVEWAERRLGVPVRDHYGQTEIGMAIINGWHPDVMAPLKAGSMGRAMPGFTASVLERSDDHPVEVAGQQGLVAIDIPASRLMWFTGYGGDDAGQRVSSDGRWYFTGDVAHADEDHFFYFSAREDDVILMAGYRIGPHEVESALESHPSVQEAAVVGAPDELRGEIVEAYVVLRPEVVGDAELSIELQEHVKRQYAAHAYPRVVHFVDGLPRTPSGKLMRRVLRAKRHAA
jgi:acetyl-CoA synthetase